MSVDRRRSQPFCTPDCERECRCSRWPSYRNRFGWPVRGTDWYDPDGEGLCCWGAWQAKGVPNFAASLIDLTGQGRNLNPFCAIGWDTVNGWIFTGVEAMGTGFQPADADQSQSMIVQFTNAAAGNSAFAGMTNGVDAFTMSPNYAVAGNVRTYVNTSGAGAGPAAAPSAAGNMCVAGAAGYLDGAFDVAVGGGGAALLFGAYLGALNAIGVPANYITANIQAFALYDCALTAAQVASVAAAMAAL